MTPMVSPRLPPVCHAQHPETGDVILIRRGEPGYRYVTTTLTADMLNARLQPPPTMLQIDAMLIGSMFGWHVAGANPDLLREKHRSLS